MVSFEYLPNYSKHIQIRNYRKEKCKTGSFANRRQSTTYRPPKTLNKIDDDIIRSNVTKELLQQRDQEVTEELNKLIKGNFIHFPAFFCLMTMHKTL